MRKLHGDNTAVFEGPLYAGKPTLVIDADRASERDWARLFDAIESGGTLPPEKPDRSIQAILWRLRDSA